MGVLSGSASKAAHMLSKLLHTLGILGAIHSQILKYLFGFSLAHPGVFLGSIVAAVALQFGGEKITEA